MDRELNLFMVQLQNKEIKNDFDFRNYYNIKQKITPRKDIFCVKYNRDYFRHRLKQENG